MLGGARQFPPSSEPPRAATCGKPQRKPHQSEGRLQGESAGLQEGTAGPVDRPCMELRVLQSLTRL
eukprot:7149054-Prymnesium_polylepis.1